MNKYKKFQITLISKSEYMEEEADNIIEFIKQLRHTDILQFDYIEFSDNDNKEVLKSLKDSVPLN